MSKGKHVLSSSLGKKLIMSLTGLFLCIFLIVHLVGNLQLFNNDGGKSFNDYAYTMTSFAPIKAVSYLLYLSIVVHAVYALIITMRNRKARPVNYHSFDGASNSRWNSRNMGILGTVLLVFIVTHMNHFWYQYHYGEVPYIEYRTDLMTNKTTMTDLSAAEFNDFTKYIENDVEVIKAKNLYKQVEFVFQSWYWVALYVIAMIALSFHLIHGFKSAFQSLGFSHKKYAPIIQFIGVWVYGVLVPAGFAAMPLYFYFAK